ncbi:MAG TPA: site-2 protease family protein [Gemmatimonadales bacterium]|nr:site-2 protease family protein [Gemmatimonadales bacterium]
MRWSFTVLRVRGTAVKIHVTLLALLGWYAWQGWRLAGPSGAWEQFLFLALLFLSVLLHEFGHIRAAARYGIPTPDVLLTPIGGIARIARMPESPKQELVIALAGPLVTLAIAATLSAGILATTGVVGLLPSSVTNVPIWTALAWTNAVLLVFNLIPAFPMDGGRVLRALLARRLGMVRGTRIAVRIGQALAVGLAVVGLSGNIMLVLIAGFVFLGAEAEYAEVRRTQGGRAGQAAGLIETDVHLLDPMLRLRDVVGTVAHARQVLWPLVGPDGRFLGALSHRDLLQGVAADRLDDRLVDLLPPPDAGDVLRVPSNADAAAQQLMRSGREALPVVDATGRFIGVLTRERMTDAMLTAGLDHAGTR